MYNLISFSLLLFFPGLSLTPGAPRTPGTAHTPGAPRTPGAAHTPGAHTPGGAPRTPGMAHTPGGAHTPGSVPPPQLSEPPVLPRQNSKHLLYAKHLPIPQEESYQHECNQRQITLYGVGKAREEARHVTKRVGKDLARLFSKKNCIDISSGDIGKKKKGKDKEDKDKDSSMTFDAISGKFARLCVYDQHAVTSTTASYVQEQMASFSSGGSLYLPLVDNIAFLLDLMHYCCNAAGLMDFIINVS